MQREAQAVSDWAEENGMELNLKKRKVMLIRQRSVHHVKYPYR